MSEAKQFVVAVGNAFDGITLYGPFQDNESALDWANRYEGGDPWEIVCLNEI